MLLFILINSYFYLLYYEKHNLTLNLEIYY